MTAAELAARSQATDAVVLEVREDTAVIRLNQPKSRNALSRAIKAHLEVIVPAVLKDTAIRSIVLTGTDGAFCAGGDISGMSERSPTAVNQRMKDTQGWSKQLLTGEKPVIAAVNGSAAGAGFSLALLCDIVLVSDEAFFRPGFSGIGAVPDLGLALTLPRAIGTSRAKEILLTNRRVEADEAVTLGIAVRKTSTASLLDDAVSLGLSLAAGPAVALGLTKTLVNQAFEPVESFLASEAAAQVIAFGSAEFDEGVAAFLGKRAADFRKAVSGE